MAQHVENNRASWSDPSHRKRFLDLCLHEINNGFRSGRTLKPSAWARIAKELETSIGKRFHQKQLKNGWDYMRKQYLEWIRLVTAVGQGYNSATHTIDWPPERWEEYLKNYPEARKFHHRPLANVKELEVLFGGVFVTGLPEIGNTSSVHSTSATSKRMIKLENGCSVPTPHSKSPNFDYPNVDEEESDEESEKRRKIDETTSEEVGRIMSELEKRDRGPSVKECMDILRKLLTFEDPLYFVAANAFCKRKEYRELWVDMESDLERIGWIQSLLKKR
ncbi:hypothetical protein Ddye_030423 [Dipteronia dyeriana]|uniref:Myb/SANT-like domain-containing protein n=1 Tax=Dipteronia dyeriana TaxID=168575 RepID=A0AAD9TH24_9ROSI|nr:hypothetical protein Ddye_030423 [Dipteronia dyeriana]